MIGSTNSIWDINSKSYEQLVNYTMLYDLGNECTDITGGWNAVRIGPASGSTATTICTLTKNSDNLYHAVSSSYKAGGFQTVNQLDYSLYSKIGIILTWNFTNNYYQFIIHQSNDTVSAGGGITLWENIGLGTTNFTHQFQVYNLVTQESRKFMTHARGGLNGRGTTNVYMLCLYKPDNWQTLAEKAGITASSINDILTNSTVLLSNKEAVEFMIYNCTGDFMASAIQSETFLTALNNSPYKTVIQANEHWAKFLGFVA